MTEKTPSSAKSGSKKSGTQTTIGSVFVTILIAAALWYFQGGTTEQVPTGSQPESQTAELVDAQAEATATPDDLTTDNLATGDSTTEDSTTEDSTTEDSVAQAGSDEANAGGKSEEPAAEPEAVEIEVVDVEVVDTEAEVEAEPAATDVPEAVTDTPSPEPTDTPEPEPTETNTPEPEPTATDTPAPTPTATGTPVPTPTVAPANTPQAGPPGMRTITMDELPPEAVDTINLIWDGGPFPFDKDDTTFGNREGFLPKKGYDYYREFTVITPGAYNRGARRIIEGEKGEIYYTEDHYDSFYWVITE